MSGMTKYESQLLQREAEKWQREDDLAGRPHRTIEQIRGEILRARRADRIRQINLATEALKNWKWALEHAPNDEENFRAEAERRVEPLLADSPYLEWGVEFPLSEEAHGPDKLVVYPEDNQTSAERTINEDRVASGSSEPRGEVVYRRVPGPWRKLKRS